MQVQNDEGPLRGNETKSSSYEDLAKKPGVDRDARDVVKRSLPKNMSSEAGSLKGRISVGDPSESSEGSDADGSTLDPASPSDAESVASSTSYSDEMDSISSDGAAVRESGHLGGGRHLLAHYMEKAPEQLIKDVARTIYFFGDDEVAFKLSGEHGSMDDERAGIVEKAEQDLSTFLKAKGADLTKLTPTALKELLYLSSQTFKNRGFEMGLANIDFSKELPDMENTTGYNEDSTVRYSFDPKTKLVTVENYKKTAYVSGDEPTQPKKKQKGLFSRLLHRGHSEEKQGAEYTALKGGSVTTYHLETGETQIRFLYSLNGRETDVTYDVIRQLDGEIANKGVNP